MKKHSLLSRLVLTYIFLGIIPVVVILGFSLSKEIRTAQQSLQEQITASAALLHTQFQNQYDSMSFISLSLIGNQEFMRGAHALGMDDTPLNVRLDYAKVERALNTYAITSSIYETLFFNRDGFTAWSVSNNNQYNYQYRMPRQTLESIEWLGAIRDNYGQTVLLPVGSGMLPGYDGETIALVRNVRNPGKSIGYLAVFTARENLDYIFRTPKAWGGSMLIAQDHRRVIYASDDFPLEEALSEDGTFRTGLLKNYITAESSDPERDLSLIIAVPNRVVYAQSVDSILPLVVEGLVMLVILAIGSYVFGRRLSAPLTTLTEVISQTTMENLSNHIHSGVFRRYDEAGYIFEQFKEMRQRLDESMKREISMQVMHVQERLHSLQAQINPHFLYNTLNVIGIMGEDAGSEAIYDACYMLSSIMRYSIADRNSFTAPLRDEISSTRAYCDLIKLRYAHRFEYETELSPEAENVEIPRLTLQPFIENIVEHAYDKAHSVVRAVIRTCVEGGRWHIVLSDDGCGMSRETLDAIEESIRGNRERRASDEPPATHAGIGVSTTIIRLQLFFGDDFTYRIESRPGSGTVIRLSGALKEDDHGDD